MRLGLKIRCGGDRIGALAWCDVTRPRGIEVATPSVDINFHVRKIDCRYEHGMSKVPRKAYSE